MTKSPKPRKAKHGAASGPRRYISYLRVSTQRQGRSGLGLEAQRETVRSFIASENGGAKLIGEYIEVESGKRSDNRPQLAKALEHASLSNAVLLISRLDRLSRNVHFLTGLLEAGVEVRACDIPSANRMVLTIMATVAEEEARLISERTRAALQAAKGRIAKSGQRAHPNVKRLGNPQGARAFGRDGQRRGSRTGVARIKADADAKAEQLRPILNALTAQGITSANRLAEALNERGVLTARGGQWQATTVIRLQERLRLSSCD